MDRIQVDGVSKRYRLGEQGNLRETVSSVVRTRSRLPKTDLWSLRDVSFSVPDGGALGILGRNGAGKSTLLKVLMRITTPTAGTSRTRGRVAGLLEVGTGFHPELTGRENVFLNAAVLGMSRRDTARHFDEIVSFAGTERFLDTPVKRYSSGMYLRLAFAVAAHLEPDVLIVDEVLAVGDAEFQRKCVGRMSAAEREGRTVVFVSHDLGSLAKLCDRSIWLEAGTIRDDGPTPGVVRDYLRSGMVSSASAAPAWTTTGPVHLVSASVAPAHGPPDGPVLRSDPFRITLRLRVVEERVGLNLSIYLTNGRGTRVLDESMVDTSLRRFPPGTYDVSMEVPPVLNVGEHSVGVWIGTRSETFLDEPGVASVEVHGSDYGRAERAVVLTLPFHVSEV